jgi:hypothetical protein
MDRFTQVKLKKDLNVTTLGTEKVMIDFDSGKYFMIKGVGNDIWDMIQTEISIQDITSHLLEEYEISETDCFNAVVKFLNELDALDFITVK